MYVCAEGRHGDHPRLPFFASDRRPHDAEMDAQSADERQRGRARFRKEVRPTSSNKNSHSLKIDYGQDVDFTLHVVKCKITIKF